MKKTLLTMVFALVGACAWAQNNLIFVDKNGNEVSNGSQVTVTEFEEDEFTGSIMMRSGLYVKYVGSANGTLAGMIVDIKSMDSGQLQHCFPGNCRIIDSVGEVDIDGADGITPANNKSIFSEWMPEAEGKCVVEYTLREMASVLGKNVEVAKCSTVTVNYIYDPAHVNALIANTSKTNTYNLQGQVVNSNYKGLVIKNGKKTIQ